MSFNSDVASTSDISSCIQIGLSAIRRTDRSKINCPNSRNINGSVDIDSCLASEYPHCNRWDYAIGYNHKCYFVEVHPASTSEIGTMINKLNWLKTWLRNQSSPLLSNHAGFHWIASGNVSISKGSPQARKLAASGLVGPKRQCGCTI